MLELRRQVAVLPVDLGALWRKKAGRAGLVVLSVFLCVFLLAALVERVMLRDGAAFAVLAVLGVLVAYGLAQKFEIMPSAPAALSWGRALRLVLSVTGGALVTHLLNIRLGLGPVLAASLVGLLTGLLILALCRKDRFPALKELPPAIYCGSFVGMSAAFILGSLPAVLLAGLLAGLLYLLTRDALVGTGGRLGTIAFGSVALTALILGPMARFELNRSAVALPLPDQAVLILVAMLAAAATFALSIRLKAGPVIASAGLSLAAALLFAFLPASAGGLSKTIPVVFIGATFAGMSARTMVASEKAMLLAGAVFALIFINTSQFFTGYGGGLGTMACLAVLVTCALASLFGGLSKRRVLRVRPSESATAAR